MSFIYAEHVLWLADDSLGGPGIFVRDSKLTFESHEQALRSAVRSSKRRGARDIAAIAIVSTFLDSSGREFGKPIGSARVQRFVDLTGYELARRLFAVLARLEAPAASEAA
jgi:hypothetical protein